MFKFIKIFSQITSQVESSSASEVMSENVSVSTSSASQGVSIDWNNLLNTIVHWILTTGIKIVIGLLVLFILFKIINCLSRKIKKKMEKKNRDKTTISVVTTSFRYGFKILFVILFISYIGINTAAIGSLITSIGLVVSLAVQGSLSNLAGGLIIIIMKPFGIGDYIVAQDCSGTVEKIKLFYTYLITPDNKVSMIPNGVLANGVITNNSVKDTRRVDFTFSISYDSDVDKAKEIIKEVELNHSLVFHTPEPFVGINEFADSSVNLVTRVWVKNEDYWTVYFDLNDMINKALVKGGIIIPYPQIDVHINKE